MISKKTFVFASLIIAILYHFILYFGSYGPSIGSMILNANSVLALSSAAMLIFVYITTNWRSDLKGSFTVELFDLLVIWIFICYFRSLINIHGREEWKQLLLSPYMGLALFPTLFFLVGLNIRYFSQINLILYVYCVFAFIFSLFFITYFELQLFLLLPIFYVILMFPMQSSRARILIFIISVVIIFTSLTNRAGIIRILISYLIVGGYYFIQQIRLSKRLLNVFIFCLIVFPLYLFYMGIRGENVFKMFLGTNTAGSYGQENLKADTRTFLYYEVLQDMKLTKSFAFGKGINAGYESQDFQTFRRGIVEVGFLQLLLKTGIVGFLLYMSLIISAIFKALNKSKSLFLKYLGLLLAGYVLLFFVENIIAYNLFNIIIWIVVGMCHSTELRNLNDQEIKELYLNLRHLRPNKVKKKLPIKS